MNQKLQISTSFHLNLKTCFLKIRIKHIYAGVCPNTTTHNIGCQLKRHLQRVAVFMHLRWYSNSACSPVLINKLLTLKTVKGLILVIMNFLRKNNQYGLLHNLVHADNSNSAEEELLTF